MALLIMLGEFCKYSFAVTCVLYFFSDNVIIVYFSCIQPVGTASLM